MNGRSRPKAAPETPAKKSTSSVQPAPVRTADDALFSVTVTNGYGGRRVEFQHDVGAEEQHDVGAEGQHDVGRLLRDDGIRRADANVDEFWKRTADQAIRALAGSGRPFTADDLHDLGVPAPVSRNAMGGRFQAAAKAGLIVKIGYQPSRRPELRCTPIAVWQGIR